MDTLAHTDVVIVGGGWTGLIMAKEIATRTSHSVVVLERGGPVRSNAEYAASMDEVDWAMRLRILQNISEQTVTHRLSPADPAKPIRQWGSFLQATGVGGAGEAWSGVVTRFLPEQFVLGTHLREKYGSKLPEDLAVQDWGFTYDEIEPYYWRAEQMLGVGGKAGNIRGKLIEGGNPFEGQRSHEYVNPPHPMPYFANLFNKGALDLGYHPYPQPSATLSQDYRNPDGVMRHACQYCGHCGYYGCMIDAKATATTTMLPVLKAKKNFTLRTNCWARRVIHRNGKAVGVTYMDASGKEVMQPADVVVLAAWSINAIQLLLMSGIGEPYNPETGKGTLGKNLSHQVQQGTDLYFDKPMNGFIGGGGVGMALSDFAGDPPDADTSMGAFRGGIIRTALTGQTPIGAFGKTPDGEVKSNWGPEWKKAGLKWYDKQLSITASANHFAYRHNYMDLDPTYKDKWGDPLIRFTLDWTEHERREAALLREAEAAIGKAMGAKAINQRVVVGAHYDAAHNPEPHIQGGAIMGSSPEKSVVNPWLQHWNMPNLWVVGGSCFPQNESHPTLTTIAITYRAADALVDRYLKRPGALA